MQWSQWLIMLVLRAAPAWADIQLFTLDEFPSLSSECVAALTATLSCAFIESGNSMYQLTADLTEELLDQMCTDECKTSIGSYREAVDTACADDEYDDGGSSKYRPIVLPDYYFTNYNQRCLKDSDGNYCLFHLQSIDTPDECDACGLQMFLAELSNSYFYNDELAEQYNSLTSSCDVSTLHLPTPTPVGMTR